MSQQASLGWRLIRRLIGLQAVMLATFAVLVVSILWATGCLLDERDEDRIVDVLRQAVQRQADGGLTVRPTEELARLQAEIPDLWFVIRDRAGHSHSAGDVPSEFARIGGALDEISQARLGWQVGDDPRRLAVRVKRVDTAAGSVHVMTAAQGRMSLSKAALAVSMVLATLVLPALFPMALATLVSTPIVIRRALAGLEEVAAQAQQIDIDRHGARLRSDNVPAEIQPLVSAVNDALERLDSGHERHKRFLADAAHELRTPIAILTTRLESLPRSAETARLRADAARLATLTDQLLDLQRLNRKGAQFVRVDLVAMSRAVAADLAPLAITAGVELSVECDREPVLVLGDRLSLERALTNLVQNAIEHGGGAVGIRVDSAGEITVSDEGDGIPPEHREKIFEPFHRLHPRDQGAGLGLNLVREIVHMHEGSISVVDRPTGASFRIVLPLLRTRPAAALQRA